MRAYFVGLLAVAACRNGPVVVLPADRSPPTPAVCRVEGLPPWPLGTEVQVFALACARTKGPLIELLPDGGVAEAPRCGPWSLARLPEEACFRVSHGKPDAAMLAAVRSGDYARILPGLAPHAHAAVHVTLREATVSRHDACAPEPLEGLGRAPGNDCFMDRLNGSMEQSIEEFSLYTCFLEAGRALAVPRLPHGCVP